TALGIHDLSAPDYGDAVPIMDGEVPVFWACGVTPQAVGIASRVPFMITHSPGHMLITDRLDSEILGELQVESSKGEGHNLCHFEPSNLQPTPMQPAIEKLILEHGTRGIEKIARYLLPDFAARAALALHNAPRVLITTGFFVDGRPETDGPPGALFLGRALAWHGARICFGGEPEVVGWLKIAVEELWSPRYAGDGYGPDFIEFPVTDAESSRALAQEIILDRQPGAVVAIERCGRTQSDRYRN